MRTGKLPAEILRSEIFTRVSGTARPDVLVPPAVGEDCSVVDFGENVCVISSDPITGSVEGVGRLAVHVTCNDIASNGVAPLGIMVTLLVPEGTDYSEISNIMQDIADEASSIGVAILGGHTELTSAVNRIIISSTAIGKAPKDSYVTSSGAKPGDALIMTKTAALEGTAILAADYGHLLAASIAPDMLAEAKGYMSLLSVIKEGIEAAKAGVHAMHDATEGGIMGAVSEMAEAAGIGVELNLALVPITDASKDICKALAVDPYCLVSSGSMIIAAPDGCKVVNHLQSIGIKATIIGEFLETERIVMGSAQERLPLSAPERDEIYRVMEEYSKRGGKDA